MSDPTAAVWIGEGFAGSGPAAAHLNVVIGARNGPFGVAWASALASPSVGHTPFMVVARPGLPVRPHTLFVNKASIDGEAHAGLTWGPAQAGVAAGVLDAVRRGHLTEDVATSSVIIAAVWVDPAATPDCAADVYANNRDATCAAVAAAVAAGPGLADVLDDAGGIWNPYFRPVELGE